MDNEEIAAAAFAQFGIEGGDADIVAFAEWIMRQNMPQMGDLLKRLLDDHQRTVPHHASLCALCMDTIGAIAVLENNK